MRVNTGSAKGRGIRTLAGEDVTRPTTQKAKEGIFSALQFHVPGAEMLDLFAGSGQMGIEALSRGASRCVFVDSSREAAEVIKENLKTMGLFKQARVAQTDGVRYAENCASRFDIIYCDPPYRKGLCGKVLPHMGKMLNEGGFAALETEKGCAMPDECNGLTLKKCYNYGNTSIWLYVKEETAE